MANGPDVVPDPNPDTATLIERLRNQYQPFETEDMRVLVADAADEIERLTQRLAEVERELTWARDEIACRGEALEAYAKKQREARKVVLEQAAKACERRFINPTTPYAVGCIDCAAAIRALAAKEQ